PLAQRHEDVRIARTDRRRSAVGEIDAAVRQSDVVCDAGNFRGRDYLADRCLDRIAQRRGLLDAKTGAGPEVQLDLAGIDGREEILAETGQVAAERKRDHCRGDRRAEENGRDAPTASQRHVQQVVIARAQPLEAAPKARLEPLPDATGGLDLVWLVLL